MRDIARRNCLYPAPVMERIRKDALIALNLPVDVAEIILPLLEYLRFAVGDRVSELCLEHHPLAVGQVVAGAQPVRALSPQRLLVGTASDLGARGLAAQRRMSRRRPPAL